MSAEYLVELITFVVMLAVIGYFAVPMVNKRLTEHQDRIAASLHEAQKTRDEVAAEVEKSRQQVAAAAAQAEEIISRAKTEAEEIVTEASARSREESMAILQLASAQITTERDQAIRDLQRELADSVVAAAGAALQRSLSETAQRQLIEDSLGRLTPPATEGRN